MGKARSSDDPNDARAVARRVLEAEARAVRGVIDRLGPSLDATVDRIVQSTGSVIVSGLGKSGLIAGKISATFASTGTPSHHLHPSDAMHGDLGRLRRDDVLMLLSYGGETDEVLALAALAQQDAVAVIAMTGQPDCHLGRIADIVLCVGDVTEACPHNLAPTASTTAMVALGDAVALAVSARRAFSAEDFAKRHPGGQLGRQLMPIVEALRFRAGDNLPLIATGRTVAEVLHEASATAGGGLRRAGAVIVVDADGRLAGIFTDG
ncbi:MAG: KpsF/GutQ family sugar-phosphate isomerase, partial [Alphaproteobacteria bacterium]|nr:KpsF/GutQ family sugar-phosphate isomerase [Alphaproteobacteria bacterium]